MPLKVIYKTTGQYTCMPRIFYVAVIIFIAVTGSPVCLADEATTDLGLTDTEKAWLADHPDIVLAPAENFYPFEFLDETGNYRGVAADYISLIEKRTGIKFRIAKTSSQKERNIKIASGEIDIVTTAGNSSEIADYMLMTRPHIIMQGVIVSNRKFRNPDELDGMRVAVARNEQWGKYIESNYPNIQVIYVPDVATGLELISPGKVDALISDMATTSYYIHREGLTEIQVVGKADNNLELGIATRRDWPILKDILEKALASISNSEKELIYRQWIHQKKQSIVHSRTFWTIISIVFSAVVSVLIAILLWNQTLKKRVLQRTASLDQELLRRYAAEVRLKGAHEKLVRSHRQLKQTQMQLINAEKMEIIGRLAAGIAHEVKNPLAVIRLGLDYLSGEVDEKNSGGEVIRDMENAVQRASLVVNSLLDFSRERELEMRSSSLNDIIEDSLRLVRHEFGQRNIKLAKNLAGDIPKMALDPHKMKQVFINLFINAIHSMREGGTLSVSTYSRRGRYINDIENGPATEVDAGSDLVIAEVTDTGSGIDEKIMDRIFDPFFTTKGHDEGTGLGLPVTKNIVDLHNGTIVIQNRESGGVSVRIILKQQDQSHEAKDTGR